MLGVLTRHDHHASESREYAGSLHASNETSESESGPTTCEDQRNRKSSASGSEAHATNAFADTSNFSEKVSQWQCTLCGTTRTPMKRNHPVHGPKTLCNACGVRLSRRVKASEKVKVGARRSTCGAAPSLLPSELHTKPSDGPLQQLSSQPRCGAVDSMPAASPRRRVASRVAAEYAVSGELGRSGAGRAGKRRLRDDARQGPGDNAKRRQQASQSVPFGPTGGPPASVLQALVHSTMLEGAKLVAQIPPEAREIPADRYDCDAHDREWIAAVNSDPTAMSMASNMSSPERSSASDITALAFDGDAYGTPFDTVRLPVLTEAQFSTIVELLERFSAVYARPEGVHEEQARDICESDDSLPLWAVCRRVYHFWLDKRRRQGNVPLLKDIWLKHQQAELGVDACARPPLTVMTGPDLDASAVNARRGADACTQAALNAQVLAATLRRHSSAVTLPDGCAGERVSEILDSIGLQRGQLKGSVGAAVQVAICRMRKENGCTEVLCGKRRGEKVGSCNFEVPGMSRLELGSLDASNDVHESLLGASLVVRKDSGADGTPAAQPVITMATRSVRKEPPPAAVVCGPAEKPDMTYIVPDDPFDSNWNVLLARVSRDKAATPGVAAPKRCVSVPPQLSSRADAPPPQCVVPVMAGAAANASSGIKLVLPPSLAKPLQSGGGAQAWPQMSAQRAMLAMPQRAGDPGASADPRKHMQQYILMSPVGMNQQGVFQVPYPFVLQQGKPVPGKDGVMQVSGPTWAVAPAKALAPGPPQVSAADMPRRPQSVPPQGTPATSFPLQCMQHPLLVGAGHQMGGLRHNQCAAAQSPAASHTVSQQLPSMPPPTSAH